MNKKYVASVAFVGLTLSFALVAPAFAKTMMPLNFQNGMGQLQRGPGVVGKVSAVNGNTITVMDSKKNTTYTVDASTATVNKNGAVSMVSSIVVGDMIM